MTRLDQLPKTPPMPKSPSQIVFSDLDDTLLPSNGQMHPDIGIEFQRLENKGIVRVIATGRNLFSARKALPDDFPIDYLIFSTGIGCLHWKTNRLVLNHILSPETVNRALLFLPQKKWPFFILREAPDNHFQSFFRGNNPPELEMRLAIYSGFTHEWFESNPAHSPSSQILVMVGHERNAFEELQAFFREESVVLTSSPLVKGNYWVEIFPAGVSKGRAANWLTKHLAIDHSGTWALGNDYNDMDLLEWANNKFLVQNAPPDLHSSFPLAPSCLDNGFVFLVDQILKRNNPR